MGIILYRLGITRRGDDEKEEGKYTDSACDELLSYIYSTFYLLTA